MNDSPELTVVVSARLRLVAGIGLLVALLLAGVAKYGVLEIKIVAGNPQATAANLSLYEPSFRMASLFLIVVSFVDILIGWSLREILKHQVPGLAALVATLRYLYAALLAIATCFLIIAIQVVSSADGAGDPDVAAMQFYVFTFSDMWDVALFFMAVHLIVLGIAFSRSGIAPLWLSVMVTAAGVCYLVEVVNFILELGLGIETALISILGETLLIAWLILSGLRPFAWPVEQPAPVCIPEISNGGRRRREAD